MKKIVTLRLEEEQIDKLKALAAEKGKSVNSYIEETLLKGTDIKAKDIAPEKEHERGSIRLSLTADEMEKLYQKSTEAGMDPKQFMKMLINNEHFVKLDIVTEDFDELLDAMYTFTKTFNSLMAPIQRSGAYPKDVEKLVELHTELNNTINQIYIMQRDQRNSLYQEARKKVFSDIKDYKYKSRKRRSKEE